MKAIGKEEEGFLQVSCEFPMGFLWVSYKIPIGSYRFL